MQFVAIHPETGIRYQRASKSMAYRWCVVTPERQVVGKAGKVWTYRAHVAWTTAATPRVPAGAFHLPAREVVDPVELAVLTVDRALAHVLYCERELSGEMNLQADNPERAAQQVGYLADLKSRLETARASLDTATKKIERLRAKAAA